MDPTNLVSPEHVPQPPVHKNSVITSTFPNWMVPMSGKICNGVDSNITHNGITFDQDGCLVFYRQITEQDRESFPFFRGINELWITMHMPEL